MKFVCIADRYLMGPDQTLIPKLSQNFRLVLSKCTLFLFPLKKKSQRLPNIEFDLADHQNTMALYFINSTCNVSTFKLNFKIQLQIS